MQHDILSPSQWKAPQCLITGHSTLTNNPLPEDSHPPSRALSVLLKWRKTTNEAQEVLWQQPQLRLFKSSILISAFKKMQILMRCTICRTEYSCGHWADCPCSSPNAVFLLPSLFWHADKKQQGKEQGGESKVSPWQKFMPNFMTLGNRKKEKLNTFTMCFKPVTSVFCWCQIQYSC